LLDETATEPANMADANIQVPVTVLTGYLGAGKTPCSTAS
jgi:tRNA A37 threonylcarbamoyladenosine biosynthesis protein TsaE